MRIALRLIVIVACALGAGGAVARAQTMLGAIVSTVRDAHGAPVTRALVSVTGPVSRSATTGSAGIVTIMGLPPGWYTLRVTRTGYEPAGATVHVVAGAGEGLQFVPASLVQETFATVASAGTTSVPAGGPGTLYAGPSLEENPIVSLVVTADGPRSVAAAALEGTRPDETRVELDGIPLAGGAENPGALRLRSVLDLQDVALAEGPALRTPNLDGAIGGIVDYRSPAISTAPTTLFDVGNDSAFGAFEHLRFSDTFGKAGLLVDGVDGQDGNTATILKGALALSAATSIELASYQAHANVSTRGSTVTSDAPAYAAGFRTTLGSSSFQARIFGSSADLATQTGDQPAQLDTWHTHGFTLGYDVPFAEDTASIVFDRRVAEAVFGLGPAIAQTVDTLGLGTNLQLSQLSRLTLGDDLSRGTDLPERNDPYAALSLRAGSALTLTLAAGSAYETVPEVVQAAAPGSTFAPETSFGYRAGADFQASPIDRLRLAAFEIRRFDDFAPLADARSLGLELGYARTAAPGRLGVDAGLDLTRTAAFGAVQSPARWTSAVPLLSGGQLADYPYSKARLGLNYTVAGAVFGVGTTLLGANNALSARAVALGDASLLIRLGTAGALRFGLENAFGQTIADPELAALLPPRELTATLEH